MLTKELKSQLDELVNFLGDACFDMAWECEPGSIEQSCKADEIYNDSGAMCDLLGDRLCDLLGWKAPSELRNAAVDYLQKSLQHLDLSRLRR